MGFKAGVRTARSGFETIYQRAVSRKGPEGLEELLPSHKSAKALSATGDDRYLSSMTRCVFSAGFVWRVVENKWPGFEDAFEEFSVGSVAGMDEADIDALAQDTRVIRNRQKIAATRDNARFVATASADHGGFGNYLAAWPTDDTIGLWQELHARGSRLGGFTGPLFLRQMGVDTFMLTGDVNKALIAAGIVDKPPTTKRALAATQEAFNTWREETGRSLCQLSRVLACSVD